MFDHEDGVGTLLRNGERNCMVSHSMRLFLLTRRKPSEALRTVRLSCSLARTHVTLSASKTSVMGVWDVLPRCQ
jgi:hypothetical protein